MDFFSKENIVNLLQDNPKLVDIVKLLKSDGDDKRNLFLAASEIKSQFVGNKVYFRGLIEYSNICRKNCYYCGIRKNNINVARYTMTDEEVVNCAKYAYDEKYSSLVLQSGELNNEKFRQKISELLQKINFATNNEMGITLSLGEQTEETLKEWQKYGGRRYLLRIETSNQELYIKLHPNDKIHDFETRLETLETLRKLNYQVGSGVMVGLPFQTLENLAEDILFFRDFDIDMIGMGPYIEHSDTPLYHFKNLLLPINERFILTLKMIAVLRIMMKDVNIVASTAMQAIDKIGREKAVKVGANILMPNLTPQKYRENYLLYQNKPCIDEEADQCKNCLEARIHLVGGEIAYGQWGDSKHYLKKQ
ncbi:MAG: [FeFe] hydrogenase H-cluster radical SAM maturase HydE [Bacteroidales bacterium]|jgi:biotin synthase|nr:[FeFe] hydrogenase H-cluster radical SAM maturase HydE [Bacteroidales bacterium]